MRVPLSGRHFAPTPSKSTIDTRPPVSARDSVVQTQEYDVGIHTAIAFTECGILAQGLAPKSATNTGDARRVGRSFTDLKDVGAKCLALSGTQSQPRFRGNIDPKSLRYHFRHLRNSKARQPTPIKKYARARTASVRNGVKDLPTLRAS